MGGIIWLASYPKSGNTWMRAFLHNLLMDIKVPVKINNLDSFCVGESYGALYLKHLSMPLIEAPEEDIAKARALVQKDISKFTDDSIFVKTHNFFGSMHGHILHNMDVTVGAIYIVRNPLDIVLSAQYHYNLSLDEMIGALNRIGFRSKLTEIHVPQIISSWTVNVSSWTHKPHKALFVVRYEDMLEKSYETFSNIASFLGLSPPKERLKRAINFSTFNSLQKQETQRPFKERPKKGTTPFFRQGNSNNWKKLLTKEQIKEVVYPNKEIMKQFGYLDAVEEFL